MPEASPLVEVTGDSEVAVNIEEGLHVPEGGAADLSGDGHPPGIDLKESVVLGADLEESDYLGLTQTI